MNTTCESTVGVLIGASERLHDVASRGPTSDRKNKNCPKSALQKLLSMVEPIMRPLTNELFEGDKEEYSTTQHSIDEIISCTGQRNSFQQFLRARETPSCSFVKQFQFLCLCKEFREWHEKPQYGPYRTRVLANYIFDNFIREGGAQSLVLSDVIRRNIERLRTTDGKVLPTMFEEAYQYVSMVIIQQNVVKSFVESHYYQTMTWDEEDLDCNLFKALSLGGTSSLHATRPKLFAGGSVGSSDPSSCSSSLSRYSRSNVFGGGFGSEASSTSVSEIQSVSSGKTGSSKSSTGSNASAAFDKYYSSKNSQKKSNKKKGTVNPAKLMEELLPRLEVISLEQSMRLQNYGSLEHGPHGDDTPVVVRNKTIEVTGETVDMSALDHMTHHSLPQVMESFNPHPADGKPADLQSDNLQPLTHHNATALHKPVSLQHTEIQSNPSAQFNTLQLSSVQIPAAPIPVAQIPVTQLPTNQPASTQLSSAQCAAQAAAQIQTRRRTSSDQSVEAMVFEEQSLVGDIPTPTQVWTQSAGGCGQLPSTEHAPLCVQSSPAPPVNPLPDIQIVYTFGSEGSCYGKAVTAAQVTLRQFKEVVAWGNCGPNTRYFFKRQLAGIGEVHDEITLEDAVLPFWAPNTIYARIQRDPH